MSKRRAFIKNGLLSTASPIFAGSLPAFEEQNGSKQKAKHWIWINPNRKDAVEEVRKYYGELKNAGFRGILFEADSEMHFREAKAFGLEAHRWNWTMNKGVKELLEKHPDWYAVSRDGKSCADNPPYVGYYRWLCPSKPEVLNYLMNEAEQILAKDYIDGLHLDYIRFCDVVLPLNLWKQYNLDQRTELPAFDFCYCETCRSKYKAQSGKDPLDLKYPEASLSWRLFRYEAITHVVNSLATVAQKHKKWITAAVFPTPEVARRNVRQDWTNWNLNAVFPMIYHGFYQEDVKWIGDAVKEGTHFLAGKFPLYAGLYLPDFNNDMSQLDQGIKYALVNGAAGISLFGRATAEVLEVVSKHR
jgi:hypothetical protein